MSDVDAERVLDVRDVSVRFGRRTILEDVSIELKAGEFTGLIGANGAGKTTLMRVILGLEKPGAGTVDVAREPGRRRPRIGYVPQRHTLDPDAPVRARDVVALGLDGHRLGLRLPSKERRAIVDGALAAVGLGDLADARAGELSGGEQQRVLIAHALAGKPRLLLLDEPLANLDVRASAEAVRLLADISRERDIAILLSAHELNALLPVLDRVVYLAGGRAVSGTADEVIRGDVLSQLYGHHVDVLRIHGRLLVVSGADEHGDLRGHDVAVGEDDY